MISHMSCYMPMWLFVILVSSLSRDLYHISAFTSLSVQKRHFHRHLRRLQHDPSLSSTLTDTPTSSSSSNSTSTTTALENVYTSTFQRLAYQTLELLIKSDFRRDAISNQQGTNTENISAGSSATNWIDEKSTLKLVQTLEKVTLPIFIQPNHKSQIQWLHQYQRINELSLRGLDRDTAQSWLRWFQQTPEPMIIDFTHSFRTMAQDLLLEDGPLQKLFSLLQSSVTLDNQNAPNEEGQGEEELQKQSNTTISKMWNHSIFQRLGCKMYILPSGTTLQDSFIEPTGSILFGKLLYGGVTRYRILPMSTSSKKSSSVRRAGEQTVIKSSFYEQTPVWIQYGGMERKYQALDIGSAAIIEVFVLPLGKDMTSHTSFVNTPSGGIPSHTRGLSLTRSIVVDNIPWNPNQIFFNLPNADDIFNKQEEEDEDDNNSQGKNLGIYSPMNLSGKNRNDAFVSDFTNAVGGLRPQIDQIVRRVLDGRVIRPAEDDDETYVGDFNSLYNTWTTTSSSKSPTLLQQVSLEAEELMALGLQPVRGLLLYGPPGCGKTALARQVSKALRARKPKIISAPELLDRWVGGSEKLIRDLFADAEAELALCNGDATLSALHVIVIDEIDAVFRKRSAGEDSGEATRSSAVNQILAKLDGVKAIPNVLIIGMTNRRELLDEALLRPGRLEVQVYVPLPDKEGRREILQIHFDALRRRGRLSKPVIMAIDGVNTPRDDQLDESSSSTTHRHKLYVKMIKSKLFKHWFGRIPHVLTSSFDLSSESVTGGFSGADLAGLVRCAGSHALARLRRNGEGVENLLITMDDVKAALKEVKK